MARLSFQNVPTKSGGVVSGNISTGAGSPFGSGGKYESQVAHIKSEIASKPEGYYAPLSFGIEPKDPVLNEKLGELLLVFEDLATENRTMEEERWEKQYQVGDFGKYGRYNIRYTEEWRSKKQKLHDRINELTKAIDENIAKEKSLMEKFQQEKMDAYAKAYMDKQLINQRPQKDPTAPAITTSPTSYLPLAVVGIVLMVILLFLRRRA